MALSQINAETTAGGIAHWITSEIAGTLRTNATDWTAAYEPYIAGIIDATVPNQVTHGGPILGKPAGVCSRPVSDLSHYFTILQSRSDWSVSLDSTHREIDLIITADNEFSQTAAHGAYFAQLEAQYRNGGVVVPLYGSHVKLP